MTFFPESASCFCCVGRVPVDGGRVLPLAGLWRGASGASSGGPGSRPSAGAGGGAPLFQVSVEGSPRPCSDPKTQAVILRRGTQAAFGIQDRQNDFLNTVLYDVKGIFGPSSVDARL